MATKTTSTRDQILSLLKKKKQMTVSTIAKELSITEMAVRRHLNTLERDNVVETTLLRQAMGRPTNVYQLSTSGQELFPRNYGELTIDLLRTIQEKEGLAKVKELFDHRKDKLKLRFEKRMFLKDFQSKVLELQKIQNEQGFMAEVNQEPDGSYTFKQFNCPIAAVAKEFPVVCAAEMQLFKELLETGDIQCERCMSAGQEQHCYYKIKQSEGF
ncbi:transcriptional regulator [Salipaludibacillus sp. CUR1]|uniref:helix-turn-helix transcriptional regulator n=1 Tax=Salipaludibacillus sp. CUR1 TaxID=2820003 RepID=UPI001E3EEDBA|nr:metalloregulator ArsR/SmtB family transcription factor [Salipaludibacillus sp. CUR1]MCE7793035.1 transcriptional regulator [Salipaludibacillus sp. CUR1]